MKLKTKSKIILGGNIIVTSERNRETGEEKTKVNLEEVEFDVENELEADEVYIGILKSAGTGVKEILKNLIEKLNTKA